MTPEQLHILQHALGRDKYGRSERPGNDRNHFCAGGKDVPLCEDLIALGYMKRHATTDLFPYLNCSVTPAGRIAMAEASPKPPKLTAGQKRYERFLRSNSGLLFGEWLVDQALNAGRR